VLSNFLSKRDKENIKTETEIAPCPTDNPLPHDSLWVSKWVDYSQKYGLGYVLRDGTVGVSFMDGTKLWVSPEEKCTYYLDSTDTTPTKIDSSKLDELDARVKKRVTLHAHFKQYLIKCNASAGLEVCPENKNKISEESVFLRRWQKAKDSIIFHLSDDTLQINFFDHTKLVATTTSDQPLLVTYIDKQGLRVTHPLMQETFQHNANDIFSRQIPHMIRNGIT